MSATGKFFLFVHFVGYAYASYFGGIGVGPFLTGDDSGVCPPGTAAGVTTAFCCPSGTIVDTAQTGFLLCCPTSADCTNDFIASGVQCADPSMTLFKDGAGHVFCCPSGYFLNDLRYCVNSGTHSMYTSTAQAASLTPDGSSPSATGPAGSGAAPSTAAATTTSASPEITTTAAGVPTTNSNTPETATSMSVTSVGGGAVSSMTSAAVSSSSSHAAGANLEGASGALSVLLAAGALLLI